MAIRLPSMLALFACLGVSFGAPVPGDNPIQISYPTQVGTEWVYQEGKSEQTLRMTAIAQKNGEVVMEISEKREAKWVAYEKLSQSEVGIFRVERLGIKIETPIRILPSPCRPGDKWERQLPIRTKATWTIEKPEVVNVPAGRFDSIPVKSELIYGDGSSSRCICWYANKVGLVKMINNDDPPLELKQFTLGKD